MSEDFQRTSLTMSHKKRMKSAAIMNSSHCLECDRRISEVTELNTEIENLKSEVRGHLDEIGDLSGRLDEAEAIILEKDEAIKSMELSLSLEQDARATLFADYRVKSDECLSLLNSLETLSITTKEKNEEHKATIEKLQSELEEKDEQIIKNQETISKLSAARSTAEEINASLQETATSLSEQLKKVTTENEVAIADKEKALALSEEWKGKLEEITHQLNSSENQSDLKHHQSQIEGLTAEREMLKQKLHDLEFEHQRAIADLAATQESQSQFVDVLTKKVERFMEEKSKWLEEKESLHAEISALKENATNFGYGSETSALQACIEDLRKEVHDLSLKDKDHDEIVNALNEKLDEYEREKHERLKQHERLHAELEALKEQSSSFTVLLEGQKKEAEHRAELLANENKDLSQQLHDAVHSVSELQDKIAALELTKNSLEEGHREEIASVEARLNETHEWEKAALQEELQRIRADFQDVVEKVNVLTMEKADAGLEIDRLRRVVTDKQHQIESLQAQDTSVSALHQQAVERIKLLEHQLQERNAVETQEPKATMEEIFVEDSDYAPNVSTPSSYALSPSNFNDDKENYFHDETFEEEQLYQEEPCDNVDTIGQPGNSQATSDEYCEFCAEHGHDTFSCSSYILRQKALRSSRPT